VRNKTISPGESDVLQFVRDVGTTHELNGFDDLPKVYLLFANNVHHLVEGVGFKPVEHRCNISKQVRCGAVSISNSCSTFRAVLVEVNNQCPILLFTNVLLF